MHNLGAAAYFARGANASAAGVTTINGTSFDMVANFGGPFDSIMAIAFLGTLTATQVTILKLQGCNDNVSWTDIAGSHQGPPADAANNGMLIVDVYRPQYRYIRAVVVRGTANAAVDAVLMVGYNAHSQPVSTQDTTVAVPVTGGSGSQGAGVPGVPVNIIAYAGAGTA